MNPETHSAGLLIVRDVLKLIADTKSLPAWSGDNAAGWTATFSTAWKTGAEAICAKFGLSAAEFLAFVRYARQ